MTERQRITTLEASELEKLFMLASRIHADHPCASGGAYAFAFIYANTTDSEVSSFKRAIEMESAGTIRALGVSEGSLGFGYAGYDHSVAELRKLGWRDRVPIVKLDVGGQVNTGSEAQRLAEHVRPFVEGEDIYIIAPPFHIVRAFFTTVTALMHNNLKVRAYAAQGTTLPWHERARHSLGVVEDTRVGLLKGELARLERYRPPNWGMMINADEMEAYLDWRDARP